MNGVRLNASQVAERVAAVEEHARSFQEERGATAKFASAFARLLNNQPQVYASAVHHARRNVVGPNAWSFKFTYEMAGNNLNAFFRENEDCDTLNEVRVAPGDCAGRLQRFAATAKGVIERIAVSAEYHKVNRRWITDPNAGLELGYPRSRSFVGSVALGAFIGELLPFRGAATPGVGDARWDFTAKYELPTDNDSEKEGLVASLTYTQKISDTFSLPISFIYSDHESDLLNVQERFSAHFGLMYKLPDLTP